MKPLRAIVAIAAASGALAACFFPAMGDLVGGSDASVPGQDSAPGDAALADAGDAGDASIPGDASDAKTDASPPTDGAPPSPCATASIFCADFDKVLTFSGGWTNTYQHGPVLGALDKSQFVSGPASFSASMTSNAAAKGAALAVVQTFPSWITKTFDVEFDVRPDMASWAGLTTMDAVLLNLGGAGQNLIELDWQLNPGDPSTGFYVELDQSGAYVSSKDILGLTAAPLQKWLHVRLHLDMTTSPPQLSVFYDGVQKLAPTGLYAGTIDPMLDLHVGLVYMNNASGPWKLQFDNVVIR